MANRDRASNQMQEWKEAQKGTTQITTSAGAPIGDKNNLQTIGPRGPAPIGDFPFEDEISHFGRERIPERVVHSKGAAAHGIFEVTHDITKYTKAKIFEHIGKKTPLFLRFSTVGGEKGSADTARDPRGFACKFYTEDGNWDLVGNNTPIFFIRDAMLFPSFIHSQKRNPRTNLKDPDMFWDFITLRPECCHQTAFHFSNRGTPDGFRFMNGYGSHTYKLINKDEEAVYVKFHMKTVQGIKNLSGPRADHLAGADPDYATRDLYNAIAGGDYPSWIFNIQVMTFAEAEKHKFNPFDMTKVWPQGEFPLIPVGKMTLNRNPKNYFAETEQSAFAPAHLIPGIEPSPDKMLQGRLFSYSDDHRHRLGTNYLQIPINRPLNAKVHNYQRDGPQCIDDNQGDAPNYFPNSFSGPTDNIKFLEHKMPIHGDISRYNTADDDNFTQVGIFWRNVLTPSERNDLISNMSSHLVNAQEFIQKRAIRNFTQCDPDFGRQLGEAVDRIMAGTKKSGANL